MTIRAIIFDIGGVRNSVQPTRSVRAWESHLGLAEGHLLPLRALNNARSTVA